jgi:hypothetical protein
MGGLIQRRTFGRLQQTVSSRSDLAGECRRAPIPDVDQFLWRLSAVPRNLTFGGDGRKEVIDSATRSGQRLLPLAATGRCRPVPGTRRQRFMSVKQSVAGVVAAAVSVPPSRCMHSSGDITRWVVPSRQGVLSFSTTCPAALVSTRWLANAGRGVGAAAHGGVQTEPVDVDAQRLLDVLLSGHSTSHRQHPLASTRAEGNAVNTRRGLQRPEHAGLVRLSAFVRHVCRALLFDQHPLAGEQFRQSVMISCNTACSASSVGSGTSTNSGAPSMPRRYTPSRTRQ